MNKKEKVDFDAFSTPELNRLSLNWEEKARAVEIKLDRCLQNPRVVPEKVSRLWNTANSMWRKIRALETYKRKKR